MTISPLLLFFIIRSCYFISWSTYFRQKLDIAKMVPWRKTIGKFGNVKHSKSNVILMHFQELLQTLRRGRLNIWLSPISHCENNGYFQKEPWDISSTAKLVYITERLCTLSFRCYSAKTFYPLEMSVLHIFLQEKKIMATIFNKTSSNRESLNMGWVENCAKLEGAKKLKWGVFVLSARGNF